MRKVNYKNVSVALGFINAILVVALGIVFLFYGTGLLPGRTRPEPESAEEPLLQNLDQRALTEQAYAYGVSSAYLQLVLPDYLIYPQGGVYHFDLIDPDLGLHGYDWSGLSYDNGRINYSDGQGTAARGVDVSYYQGAIDWPAVAADGIDFALVRLGYRGYESGALVPDENAAVNLDGARAAGLQLGAYFFSQAVTEAEAEEEAAYAVSLLAGRELDYPLVYDMEEIGGQAARTDALTRQQATDVALAFCRAVEQAGYQAMIYGNVTHLAGRLDLARLKDTAVWLAQYQDKPQYPYHFQLWQYTSSGTVTGIGGAVDLNLAFNWAN